MVDGREVRWVAMEVDLQENGSGVESDTKAGTDEYFEPPKLLRFGDWTLIIARSDKEFISFLSPLVFIILLFLMEFFIRKKILKEQKKQQKKKKIEPNRKREKRC